MKELDISIDIQRKSTLEKRDSEINTYIDIKKRELRVWESKERCAVQQRVHDYETSQRKEQKSILEQEYESKQKDIVSLCETQRQTLLETAKNEVASEISAFRTEELRKAKAEIDSMYEALSEDLQKELIRFENTERLVMNQHSDAEKDKIVKSLAKFEADMRASINERISVDEETERQNALFQRELALNQKLETLRQNKEIELTNLYNDMDIKLKATHLKKKTELDMSLKLFAEEKEASINFELELYRTKQRKDIETEHEKDILAFKTKMAEEYTKIQVSQKELNQRELDEIQQQHEVEISNKLSKLQEYLTIQNEKETQTFKAKLRDEFTRLRLVEKMILQSDMEKEFARLRERLSPEYESLKKKAEEDFQRAKAHFASKLSSEKLSMEEEYIKEHSIACASYEKSLESEFATLKAQMEKELQKEAQLRRTELLRAVNEDVEAYKTLRLKDATHDISIIRERELEEMRESLYVLAMERVKEKMSNV
jgi:hypothetical protein